MRTGVAIFRERAGLSKAELARRVGTTRQQLGRLEDGKRKLTKEWAEKIAPILGCTPSDLLFPEMARIDTARFKNVFEVDDGGEDVEYPLISLDIEFLKRLLPSAGRHRLRLMMVDSDHPGSAVAKNDAVVIDMDDIAPTRPGLYAIEIAGAVQWRYLTPTTTGMVQVHTDNRKPPEETVKPDEISILGRARLRISTL